MLRDPTRAVQRAYPWLAATLIAAALALRWPCLHTGFMVDDYLQLAMIERVYPVLRSPLALFTFATGNVTENEVLRAQGLLAWWSDPELRIAMFRPLASAMLWLDHESFLFVMQTRRGLQPFTVPAVGGSAMVEAPFPAIDLLR